MKTRSNTNGGRRTVARHGAEFTGLAAAIQLLVMQFDGGDDIQKALLSSAIMGAIGMFVKAWHENGVTSRILNRILPASLVVLLGLSGCAGTVGVMTPTSFTGVHGETIVAYEIKGVSGAFGDGGVGQAVEGGHISSIFSNMVTGTFEATARVVGGLFTGIGAAGSAINLPAQQLPIVSDEPDAYEF